ncbi:MAG: hypothetical protein J6P43_00535, partial [Succinivibrionaceae bacterium]|nr:hypothetical protein [Succinivibrionaceae bacterium]
QAQDTATDTGTSQQAQDSSSTSGAAAGTGTTQQDQGTSGTDSGTEQQNQGEVQQQFSVMGIVGSLGNQGWNPASPTLMDYNNGNWISQVYDIVSGENTFKIFTDTATSWDDKDDVWSICPNTEQNQLTSATACQATGHGDGVNIEAPVGRYQVSVNEQTMKVSFIEVTND